MKSNSSIKFARKFTEMNIAMEDAIHNITYYSTWREIQDVVLATVCSTTTDVSWEFARNAEGDFIDEL